MNSPFEQYKIYSIIKISSNIFDITINNSTIYMILSIIIPIIIINIIYNNNNGLTKGRWKIIIEILYKGWEDHLKSIIGNKYKNYIVIIISTFIFILINNLIGLIPYNITTTAQIIITLTLSLTIFIGVTIIGIKTSGIKFIKIFIPSGIPKILLPLIFFIELLSYLSRIISLSVRLTANMISGHTILNIISGFGVLILSNITVGNILIGGIIFPIIIIILFSLELFVSIIQSYVFSVLTATYIKDVLSNNH